MKKGNLILLLLAVGLVLAMTGCSGGGEEAAKSPAAEAATEVANTHDCDGGCGMKAVPMDKLTEVDGKFYCAGCAGKAKAEDEAEGSEDSHEGHNHG